ncbi:MAG: hypothetical protein NT052_02260 [Candidatus Shapirobacteria bacterium]|nr:hypothetical protein [Candidatus Shapirobacteria bacterium]
MSDIFGKIEPPSFISKDPSGMITLFNNILRLLIVVGGIYTLLNFILAGFQFISAGGDPKKIEAAWAKIWQSMIGLLIIVASFALAALLGQILFHSPTAILNPVIYGPGGSQTQ